MTTTSTEVSNFGIIKRRVAERFQELTEGYQVPFMVDYDRDDIWQAYHDAFQTEEWKQANACNACKSFILKVGGIITVDPIDLEVTTLWDFRDPLLQVPEEYLEPLAVLDAYVRSQPINGLFYHNEPTAGTDKNVDSKRDVVWEHFYITIPRRFQDVNGSLVRASAELREARTVLLRSLQELTVESMQTVLGLIDQGSLYRGPEYEAQVERLLASKAAFDQINGNTADCEAGAGALFSWVEALDMSRAWAKTRNSAIGQLLIDLSEGEKDLEGAVRAYESMAAPTDYQRPKALVTPRMVEPAQERLNNVLFMEGGAGCAVGEVNPFASDKAVMLHVGPFEDIRKAEAFAEAVIRPAFEKPTDTGWWLDRWMRKVPSEHRDTVLQRLFYENEEVFIFFTRELEPEGQWAISFPDDYWIDTAPSLREAEILREKLREGVAVYMARQGAAEAGRAP